MQVVRVGKRFYHLLEDMKYWCNQHVGAGGYLSCDDQVWRIETDFGDSEFLFVHDEDAVAFRLRFSENDGTSST